MFHGAMIGSDRLDKIASLLNHLHLDEAVDSMIRGVREDPANPQRLIELGMVLISVRRPSEAISVLEYVKTLDQQNPDIHGYLGQAHYFQGNIVQARESIRESLAVDPNNVPALNGLGMLEIDQGNYQEAEQALTRIIDTSSPYPPILVERAVARAHLEKFTEALNDLDRALRIDSTFVSALQSRAGIYDMMGKKDLADHDRQKLSSFSNAEGLLRLTTAKKWDIKMIHVRIGNSLLFNDNRGHGICETNDSYFFTVDHGSNRDDKFLGDEPDLGVFIWGVEAFTKNEAFFESMLSRDFNVFNSWRRGKG